VRAVVDTSTAFSALAFNGPPARVLAALHASEDWELAISPQMRDELQRAPAEKAKDSPDALWALQFYFSQCLVVIPTQTVCLCRDSDDDFILDCAIAARAQLLITSDNDLLALSGDPRLQHIEVLRDIEIINVPEAQRRFVTGLRHCTALSFSSTLSTRARNSRPLRKEILYTDLRRLGMQRPDYLTRERFLHSYRLQKSGSIMAEESSDNSAMHSDILRRGGANDQQASKSVGLAFSRSSFVAGISDSVMNGLFDRPVTIKYTPAKMGRKSAMLML
jgi:uncharacterized protein